jgi:hypothetical protein
LPIIDFGSLREHKIRIRRFIKTKPKIRDIYFGIRLSANLP